MLDMAKVPWVFFWFACHPLNNFTLSSHDSYCFLEVGVQIREQ